MNFLEERIAKDGIVKPGNVLKVDSFLNHQMDVKLLDKIGEEFYKRFSGTPITKVLTIETSGVAIAYAVARCFDVPMVFAKKSASECGCFFAGNRTAHSDGFYDHQRVGRSVHLRQSQLASSWPRCLGNWLSCPVRRTKIPHWN